MRFQNTYKNYITVNGWALAYHYKSENISYIFYMGVYEQLKGEFSTFDLITGMTFNHHIKGRLKSIQDAIKQINNNEQTTLQVITKIEALKNDKEYYRYHHLYINKSVIEKLQYKNQTYLVGFIPNTKKRVLMRGEDINNIKIKVKECI